MFVQPTYEQDKDRKVQDVVFEFMKQDTMTKSGRQAVLTISMPGATVDFIWKVDGITFATAELKRRNVKHDKFPTLMVSAHKLSEMQRFARRGYMLVLYTDGLYFRTIRRGEEFDIQTGGRTTQSRDAYEAAGEKCAYIPIEEMKPVPGWNAGWTGRAWAAAGANVWT